MSLDKKKNYQIYIIMKNTYDIIAVPVHNFLH